MTLTVGSLFSGIEGFGKGFEDAGLKVVWQVEIDPDAQRVLRHHWPDAELLEDVCKVGKKNLKPVDVICGGFPCQDLSVAGKRAGLKGKRSSLFFQFTRIINELRPSVVVLENVPGLRSSPPEDPGRDFETLLQTVAALRVYECGWTGLDARWFGVAQRRQRVFYVLTHKRLGTGCSAEILALTRRREGHFATGEEAEPDIAGTLGGCTKGAGWGGDPDRAGAYIAGPLQAHAKRHNHAMTTQQAAESDQLVAATIRSRQSNPGVNPPGRGGEDDQNLVVAAFGGNNTSGPIDVATAVNACKTASGRQDFETETSIVNAAESCAKERHARQSDTARCLDQTGWFASNQGGTVVAAIRENVRGEVDYIPGGTTYPVCAGGGKPGQGYQAAQIGMLVRRLTPVECSRLQGFSDDHLDLDPPLSDSAKYRLLGNAVAVPVARWLGQRIRRVLQCPES